MVFNRIIIIIIITIIIIIIIIIITIIIIISSSSSSSSSSSTRTMQGNSDSGYPANFCLWYPGLWNPQDSSSNPEPH